MEVAAVSVRPGRERKRFPKIGEMVRLEDRKGLFLVMGVDRRQRLANLMQRVGRAEVLNENVPFKLIENVSHKTSRLIASFLHS